MFVENGGSAVQPLLSLTPAVQTVLTKLQQAGYEAYLVGGIVRDAVRGVQTATDWDITTDALPEVIERIFAGYRVIETGIKHGTVTVMMENMPIEITTYRIDGTYSDGRHPDQVTFTRSLQEDLARRDFTMNAMAYHPESGLVDPFGGQCDLAAKCIRCVGEPQRRFREDALRILRALRFAAVFSMSIAPETAEAIHREKEQLCGIAVERIRVELEKLLCGVDADRILRDYADVFAVIIPALAPMFGFLQHHPCHCYDVWEHTLAAIHAISPEPVLRWAALLHDIGKPSTFFLDDTGTGHFYGHAEKSAEIADAVLKTLKFDRAGREEIVLLVRYHGLQIPPTASAAKRAVQRFGAAEMHRLIALFDADTRAQSACCLPRLAEHAQLLKLVEEAAGELDRFSRKNLSLSGEDLLAMGLQGREIGEALNVLVDAVVYENINNDKECLLGYLQNHLDSIHTKVKINCYNGKKD